MFIEVQNSDEVFLSELYKQVAASSPDYEGVDCRQAVRMIVVYMNSIEEYAVYCSVV